jgi:glycosidase
MSAVPHSVAALNFAPVHELHPSPQDWRDQVFYFLLVDRFDNGAPDLVPFVPGQPAPPAVAADRHRFQGGKIEGITRRLDYIRGLGCTAVWVSPVLKNRLDTNDYHGYGIQDFLEVDPRFGTLEDLQQLTSEAHARGMYVILDIVLNHTGDVWSYPGNLPYYYYQGQTFPFAGWRESDATSGLQLNDAVWPSELQREDAFKRRGQIRHWDEYPETRDGDFLSLKELDLPKPYVLDTLIKIYKYWIAAADVDGYRLDTVKHMEDSATAIFCNAVREYAQRVGKHRFFMFGEIAASDKVIQDYLGRNARIQGTNERFPSLDAALDFPLYNQLEDVIKGFKNPAALRARYDAFRDEYADHGEAGRNFVTFVDNHDQIGRPRQRFMHGNPHPQQAVLAMAYLLTAQGVPCIYYGTEQGFDGGGEDDSYLRECMFGGTWGAFGTSGRHFFNPDHEIYRGIRQVAAVRATESALRYGRQYFREISGNGVDFEHPLDGRCTLAYSRILDTEEVLIAMNLTTQARNDWITVDRNLSAAGHQMRDLLDPQRRIEIEERAGRACVRVALPPHGLAILKSG